jgi:hypothetical protein
MNSVIFVSARPNLRVDSHPGGVAANYAVRNKDKKEMWR